MAITLGVDEAGRGCWAGPVVAAAVILRPGSINGLTDSKKLSAVKRVALAATIRRQAAAIGVGVVPSNKIDAWGLTEAVRMAMRQAVQCITIPYDRIIIDGNYNFLADHTKSSVLIKADQLVSCVSAASIIAKTTRDGLMREIAAQYPGYAFERHVGYGTAEHRRALTAYGPCAIHRFSYKPVQAYEDVQT